MYALPLDSDPDLYLDRHQEALRLSPLQKDFLLNHLGLPLVIPAASMGGQSQVRRRLYSILRKMARAADRLPRRRIRILAAEESQRRGNLIVPGTGRLLAARRHGRGRVAAPPPPLSVVMAAGRGFYPAVWRHGAGSDILLVRRRHPLTILAARAVARDRANAELAFAALAPRRFLTGTGR